jgi:hypothetical protein
MFLQSIGRKYAILGQFHTMPWRSLARILYFSITIILFGRGAATGAPAVAGAIGGTTTIANEAVFATVQQDAKRTATQIAARIAGYYRTQGWTY